MSYLKGFILVNLRKQFGPLFFFLVVSYYFFLGSLLFYQKHNFLTGTFNRAVVYKIRIAIILRHCHISCFLQPVFKQQSLLKRVL